MSQNVHPIQFLEIDGLEVSSLEIGHKKGSRLIKNTSNKKIVAELKKKHILLTFLVGISSIQVDMKLEVNAIRIRISGKIQKLLSFLLKNWNQIGGPKSGHHHQLDDFSNTSVCVSAGKKSFCPPSSSLSSGWTRCLWHWQKHLCKSDDSNGQ